MTLGKSATDIRAEACDFLLDADHSELRNILRTSVNNSGRTYSNWIRRLSSDDYPCDEFGLFLLSFVFKHHVIVILASKMWCTFKTGRMSTFEKICKADHILVWMGEDRYAEVKPLHVETGLGSGNIVEWQQLSESVDLLHSKSKNRPRRVEKATTSISTPVKNPRHPNPVSTRQPTKRECKVSIDYKQLHEDGVFEEKRRRVDKYLPKSSGPSETRLEAQRQILNTKKSPEISTTSRKVATDNQYVPLRNVTISDNTMPKNIKQEQTNITNSARPIKPEPGIFLRHRKNPSDRERVWKYVHVSGRRCNQGGERDCNSQSENEDESHNDNTNTLPDLPTVIDLSLPDGNSNCGNSHYTATVQNSLASATPTSRHGIRDTSGGVVDLVSPPAIGRPDFIPSTDKNKMTRNLGDLLCTLNFDVQPEEIAGDKQPTEDIVRNVATSSPTTAPNLALSTATYVEGDASQSELKNRTTTTPVRTVVTTPEGERQDSTTGPQLNTPLRTRSVTTVILSDSSPNRDTPAKTPMKDAAAKHQQ